MTTALRQLEEMRDAQTLSTRHFRKLVLDFYSASGRQFSWRLRTEPYAVWVSEVMLQQTQTSRVVERYPLFLDAFPTVEDLASASLREVLELWDGMGYYRRAATMHQAAVMVARQFRGRFPATIKELRSLPGVGAYTAAAIRNFAFNEAEPMIETNIRSVFLHLFFPGAREVPDTEILKKVAETIDRIDPRTWFYALMDLGVCVKQADPAVGRRSKQYSRQSPFEGSFRQKRAAVLKSVLRTGGRITVHELAESLSLEGAVITDILLQLEREGLLDRGIRPLN